MYVVIMMFRITNRSKATSFHRHLLEVNDNVRDRIACSLLACLWDSYIRGYGSFKLHWSNWKVSSMIHGVYLAFVCLFLSGPLFKIELMHAFMCNSVSEF
jgi:hypothetical protein